MRGNPSNTISPFVLFSVHNPSLSVSENEAVARNTVRLLTDRKVPFKRIASRAKGLKNFENLFIVDVKDKKTAHTLVQKSAHETLTTVDLNRVGTRIQANILDKSATILGTLENVSVHALDDGAAYLQDAAGTTWAWT